MLLLKNCHLVGVLTEGVDFTEADVLLKDGVISEIAPAGTLQAEDAVTMDLGEKTLMPGLIDMHIHLITTDWNYDRLWLYTPAEFTVRCMEYATSMLDLGYTTIRDCGDNPCRSTVPLARSIEAGRLTGPTIIPGGPIMCPTAPNTATWLAERIDGVDNTRKVVRENLLKGAQFIKMYGSASMSAPTQEVGYPIIEEEEIREAVKIAKNYNTYVAIHSHGARAIDQAVRAGVHTVEHASLISEETLQYIEKTGADVGIVPTLFVFSNSLKPNPTITPAVAAHLSKIKENVIASLKNAYRHGIRIGWGTDVVQTDYEATPGKEFQLRKEWLEFSNEDILRQATIQSAKLMYLDDKIGSVKTGKAADLIVVDRDPVEDISVMYDKPLHVIKKGTVIR